MKRLFPFEFVYQLFALLVIVILVHGVYASVVRPQAAGVLQQQQQLLQEKPDAVVEQSVWVILKDYEQEACFILFFWAIAIMAFKARMVYHERRMLHLKLIDLPEGTRILQGDIKPLRRKLQSLDNQDEQRLLPSVLQYALRRFETTQSIAETSLVVKNTVENEGERLDAELSMIRYIAWAIPSIGFIGTVRGIGLALGQAHQAVEGDITGVTHSLGTAFNSTLVALLLSILLMFVVHQLQLAQERLILDVENYGDRYLIANLKTLQQADG
ncbi:MAG: MotA/TolQ/ExbB proton channel family protein [gamma proteobacterium symbiont of Bathyaustriella thionipta]|nr:MotA/TolQ/ExbB proton channel family protein [gamma proteobacterium symbiont of Bathyaustriella thionipta]